MANDPIQLIKMGEFLGAFIDTKTGKDKGRASHRAWKLKAEKALLRAMKRRGWKQTPEGYALSGNRVTTTDKDYVIVNGKHEIKLGQGAIVELDAYISTERPAFK